MSISGQQNINIGLPNESAGSDSLYTAFTKTQQNFNTLFACSFSSTGFVSGNGINVTSNTTTGIATITNTGVTNIIAGTNITIDQSNGNVTISSTGGGSGNGIPGGSNAQVQFNNAGLFGGSPNFTFNQSTGNLTITGNVLATNLIGNGYNISSINASNVTSGSLPRAQAPSLAVRTIIGNTTVTPTDNLIMVNSTSTIFLPSASTMVGVPIQIQNNGTGVTVTVLPSGTDLINGYANVIFTNKNSLFGFLSTGTSWVIF